MIHYSIPKGVYLAKQAGPFLVTAQGGKIVIDETVARIWEYAGEHDLETTLAAASSFGAAPALTRSVLACLAEAGLLKRLGEETTPSEPTRLSGKPVSAIILGFNDRQWLERCLSSLIAQTYTPLEIIVVDNASTEPFAPWLKEQYPQVKTISLNAPLSFAAANNRGVAAAQGEYYLLLNQDTFLEPDAVAQMVAVIEGGAGCVCVAPKLHFSWAPAFLNGVGNRIQLDDYGTDNAIGQLDLGQYDHWEDLPSACFAAALISREGWQAVGRMDECFPMYYEDVEWGYRARLLGYTVKLAPKAVVYHAFGASAPAQGTGALAPAKLYHVTYGRYRFTLKLLDGYQRMLLLRYLFLDFYRFGKAVLKANGPTAAAYLRVWQQIIKEFSNLRQQHQEISLSRKLTDEKLFALQARFPANALRNGLPDLSLERIQDLYLPLLTAGKTRPIPEY